MKSTGNFVRFVFEFSPGVKFSKHNFNGADSFGGVNVCRNSTTVVLDGDRTVYVNCDLDCVTETGHGFVDGVIDDLKNEVVIAPLNGIPDIHTGTFTHRVEAFEDLDICGAVVFWIFREGLIKFGRLCVVHPANTSDFGGFQQTVKGIFGARFCLLKAAFRGVFFR